MQEYRIEKINEQKINDFVLLFNTVYSSTLPAITQNEAQTKFNTEAFGNKYIGFLAYHNNTPIAYSGVYPIHLNLNGQIIIAAQSGDIMTHPDYRKQGANLQMALHRETYDLCLKNGIVIIYSFPGDTLVPGMLALGWKKQCTVSSYTLNITPTLKSRLHRKLFSSSFNKIVAKRIKGKNSNMLKDITFPSSITPFHTNRSEAFYQYKLNRVSSIIALAHGYALLKVSFSGVLLGDYYIKDKEYEHLFWEELTTFARKMGCYSITFDMTPDLEKHYTLPKSFTKTNGRMLILFDLGLNTTEYLSLTSADYDTF